MVGDQMIEINGRQLRRFRSSGAKDGIVSRLVCSRALKRKQANEVGDTGNDFLLCYFDPLIC